MLCAFCCDADPKGPYVELEVTLPEASGNQRQLLGAHAGCLTDAMAEGFAVEIDLLDG